MLAKTLNRRMALALAGIGLMGLMGMGEAQATAIAYSSNQLSDFIISSSAGSTITLLGTPQRNTQNSATYGPTGGPGIGVSTQDPQPLGNRSDALQTSAGPGAFPGQNNFARVTDVLLPGMVGARADSDTSAGSPFGPGGVPYVRNVAEARVTTGSGFAGAGAGINSANAALSFNIALGGPGTISFAFDNLFELFASTTAIGEGAQGTVSNIFSIFDSAGNTVFSYAPPQINVTCASNSGVPAECHTGPTTLSFLGTSGLLDVGIYTISLLTSSAATVASRIAVPEPGSSAIFALGLGSLLVMRRYRRN